MQRTKRFISALLVLCLVFGQLPAVFATEIAAAREDSAAQPLASSGTCGANLTWTLSDDGVLTISGTGCMVDYSTPGDVPWFENCASITTVVISEGVTTIGDWAFCGCDGLTSVTIPEGVTTIGDYAFYDCGRLTGVTIGDSVTTIGDYVFKSCDSLASVTIGDSVTTIGDSAFYDCGSLTGVTIPDSVTIIGNAAFSYCESLTSVTIGNSVTTIGGAAFSYCDMASVTIPDSVTTIGNGAFFSCNSLISVTIPDSVTTIGDSAFYSCDSLTNVTIGNSVTTIGEGAFDSCKSLISVTIPDSVTTIGDYPFRYCDSLTGIYVDENNPNYSSDARGVLYDKQKTILIQGPGAISGSYSIPNSVTTIGDFVFSFCKSLTSVTIGDSVTVIGEDAFCSCDSLASVIIGDSVTTIGKYAFSSCARLTSVTIPDSVTTIGSSAFKGCSSLTSVTIPDSVTTIGAVAFSACDSLTSVTIGNSVTTIGRSAFSYCNSLEKIQFCGSAPSFGNDVFYQYVATAYYPANDTSWTSDVMQNYSGTITWLPYYPEASLPNNGTYTAPQESVWYDIWCVGDRYKSYERNFTLTVGDDTYSTGDSYKVRADIPYDLSDQVSVSKDGWITCEIPRELVYACREVVLHPDTTTSPFVNFIAARNNGDSIYVNLACSHLSVYENAMRTYDMYVDINWNGQNPGKVYLQQGDLTMDLNEGKNIGLLLGIFSASNGDVLLCWETADGAGYSQGMYLDICKNSSSNFKLNGGEDSAGKNPASAEEDEMWGELAFEIDLFDDLVPVEMTMTPTSATTGTFRGSLGIKIENYENKRAIIDLLDTNLNTNWDYTSFKSMKDLLKTKFPDSLIPQQASSFVISVDTEFLGYVEGTYTLGKDGALVDMEFTDSKIVTGLDGELSTARQHLTGYVPWYWELELKAGVALALELQNEYDGTSASIAPVKLKRELEIGAKVAAGIVKTAGLGVRGGGTAHVEGQILPVDLSKTDIYADYDIALFLQLGNWKADIFPYQSEKYYLMNDGEWAWEDASEESNGGVVQCPAVDTGLKMEQISRNYLTPKPQAMQLNSDSGNSDAVVYANTYTFTEPKIVRLSEENMLMVWIDDPGSEIRPLDVNRTALYYSVYDGSSWGEATMVHDDGTADGSPVLRNIDGNVYLVWSNCNTVLAEDAQYEDYCAALDLAYARFDSESGSFVDISSVDTNAHSDFLHDITVVNGAPIVTWVQNSENDLLLGTGVNTLYAAKLNSGEWEVSVLADGLHSIDGLCAANEDSTLTVYISQDTDGDVSTISDCELFAVTDNTITQITENTVSDLKPAIVNDTLYWYQDGSLTDGTNDIELAEDTDRFVVAENDSCAAVLYKRNNDDNTTTICAHILSDGVWSFATEIATVDQHLQYFDAVILDDGSIVIVTNEIEMVDNAFQQADLCLYQVEQESDLEVQTLTYNPLSIAPSGKLELIAAVQNIGAVAVDEATVQIYEGETLLQEDVVRLDLDAGAASTIMLTYPLESAIPPASIRVELQPVDGEDRDPENNAAECVIPWYDVSVEELAAIQTNAGTQVSVYVSNRGLTELSDIQIELYTQESGKKNLIASKMIDSIAVAMGEIVTFETDLESDTIVFVDAVVDHDEFNDANNSGFALIAEGADVLTSDDETATVANGWSGSTTWILTSDGVLAFSGDGNEVCNMKNYGFDEDQPWISYADQITSVVVEDGVTAVGSGAFRNMTKLESVTLPATGLNKIGEAAFYGCTNLKEIYIPDGVYTIWEYTFKNCTSLTSIRLPATLVKVDQGAFEACTALAELFIPGDTEIIGAWSFKGCSALTAVDMTWVNATEIRDGAFKNCTALTDVVLPADIQVLGDSAFYGIGAESFTIPATVTEVGPWCFARAALTEVTFEGDAPTIGEGAFNKITLTAFYPGDNATWTSDIMQNYGGTVTWKVR